MEGRRPALLLVLAVFGLALLTGLGFWQLQRRDWKSALLAQLEQNIASEPAPYTALHAGAPQRRFQRVRVQGRFRPSESVYILAPARGRPAGKDGFGYLVLTPLDTRQGTVMVNRGYVPDRGPPVEGGVPAGETEVTGIIRLPDGGGSFTPDPKLERRLFFAADIPAMARAYGWLNQPGFVANEYIEADTSTAGKEWPQGRDPRELLASIPNRHLEYALTWFGLALTLFVVASAYAARLWRSGGGRGNA